MSKILVLNGSPRKGGNTEMLVNAFKNGAEMKGHEVEVVYVQGKNRPVYIISKMYSYEEQK